ncbi:propanediol utilization protein [Defluviimonas sp. WL0075]|uniref:Propanediol utilization protein n=1 Tax=Albidovulum sediminicola TaxID=2984331 RepID=A0ABT2YYN2_9RHOB|nr:propanediol utilization protein [Defluviimonas sp. WL0075]MCV2864002.1 propanediol utilization protein [Defluviimonas sp. WL0075]
MTPHTTRVAGHFGELLQGRLGADGPVVLVTLPCPALTLDGIRRPGPGLHLHGHGQRLITPQRARRLLSALGLAASGRFGLRAAMPLGGGAGASTAALVALARLAGWAGPPEDLARACIACEGASDPLMFPAPERLIWASRLGRAMGRTAPLPALEAVGGFFGPMQRTDPQDGRFADISDLLPRWSEAARARDAGLLAALSSTSARRTLALRGPAGDPTEALARDIGALGFAIAHTGAARALLFAPRTVPEDWRARLRAAGLRGMVRFRLGE